ncbi:MAG: TetR family transcriptional regulator [Deltaproteobacteria bacterium]|nr:TetR family transcriptional regulator [Deltaproteobacteria bacterium]MCB9478530.1 TetR family transcriptional regulator [Deltaproteobacteria bacterium]
MQQKSTTSSSAPLRERKKARTRETIILAATKLFAKKGFENTSVEDIVAEVDISRSTFFRYFPTKELVMFPHQDEYLKHFRALLRRQGGESAMECVRRACLEMTLLYQESREDHLRQQRIIQNSPTLIARGEAMDRDWRDAIAQALLDGKRADAPRRRQATVLASAILGAVSATLEQWYADDCKSDLVDLGREALDILVINDDHPFVKRK